ncbi:MAG: AbrB/MazE/SpoVT family DNA-binding domain-containing protein [Thermoplasmatales archaeon]|jgi:AbrB family looped-hinge helix DNA binding protein|nr:AbrB/MazE/SpoVT family DNA-binding domain-containing protein [Thermoplasmatales archaeon]
MEAAIAKMSSKGQIVIPSNMRKDIEIGEEFLIIKDQNRLILKKITKVTEKLKEDLMFAKRVEKAWKDYEKGKFKSTSADKFLEKLEKC